LVHSPEIKTFLRKPLLKRKTNNYFSILVGCGRGRAGSQFLRSCCCCIIIAVVVHQAGGAHQARASFVFSLSLSLSPQPNAKKESKQASKTHTHTGEITSLQAFAPCSSSISKSLAKFLGALYLLTSRLKMTAKFWISQPEEV
jgi:hypothetical protein